MLQRTRDSSIHIHICEPVSKIPFTAFGHGGPAETTDLVQAIAPHTRRVHSLDVESGESSEEFVRAVMNLWLDDGSVRLPRSVVVYQSEKARDLFFEGSINRAVASLEESREVLQSSPGILQLYNVYLSWDNPSYHGLAELELGFPERTLVTIPEPQLASILSASPALAVLKLDNLIVTPVEGSSTSTPIILSCLKVLRVFLVSPQSTNLFLPLIRPSPTSPIQVSMAVTDFPEIYEETRRFFADSCITALHCHALDTFDSAMSLLQLVFSSLYHLSTLVLSGFDLHHLAFQINQTFSQPTSFVCRPAIVLLACRVTFEGLDSLILRHGVRDLRLEHCRSIGPGVFRITLRSIQASLLEVYPDLRCSISDAMDSTSKLPCRTMLGRPAVWQSSQIVNRLMAGW
ncbi:hypothetical protein FRC12_020966 [Ceratobasidium sp. 428]|nr:hypothetical protein FRC12_020966 [Ceratobasidium sp. 428]